MKVKSGGRTMSKLESRVLAAIPDNWLDSLLTGPNAVLGEPPWYCPDVERLLKAVRERVRNEFVK